MGAKDREHLDSWRDPGSGAKCSVSVDRSRGLIYFDVAYDPMNGGGAVDRAFLQSNPYASAGEILSYIKGKYAGRL